MPHHIVIMVYASTPGDICFTCFGVVKQSYAGYAAYDRRHNTDGFMATMVIHN